MSTYDFRTAEAAVEDSRLARLLDRACEARERGLPAFTRAAGALKLWRRRGGTPPAWS